MQTDTVRMEKVRTRARVLTFVATLCLLLAGIACERRSASPSGASSTASVDAPAGRSDLQQLDVPTDLADDLDSNGTPYRNDAPAGVLLPAPTTTSGPDQVERLDETDPLAVTRLAVNVHVVGRLSITTVDQTFHNNTSMRMEGRYYFPLPAGSSLARFAMYVGDSLMEGEFLERLQARGIYESILRQKRDPALLEMMEGNTFRARVFPIEAHGDKRIILAYSQYLPQEADGTVLYRYPLNVAYHASRPLDHFSIDGIVTGCGDDLTVVERSTGFGTRLNDERNARRETGRACHFSASATTFRPPSDFTLAIRSRQLASNSGLASAGTGDDDADYFVASFAVPPPPPADRRPVDVTFLIDTSAGVARRTYKRALQMAGDAWSRLEASDGVSIMTFDIAARPHGTFAGGAARATAWLDHELGNDPLLGGTNLVGAVSAAIDAHAAAGSAHDHHIVIVSDGIATLGEFRPDDVRQAVQQQLAGNDQTRISALAVGSSIDELVLSALAGAFRGTVVPAHDGVDMHRAVSELVGAIATPPARVVSIAMKGGTVSDLRPGNLPSVNARATICGRFRLPQDASPVLQVLIERGAQRQLMDVPLTRTSSPLVARHWAVETANEAQRNPAGVPDGFDIIAHSRRYRILTQATAVLVLETEQDYRRFGITRIHAAPEDTEMLLAARLSATPAAPAAPEQPTDEPADEPVEEPAAPSPEAAPAASAAPAPATPVDEQMPDDLYPADPVLRARFNAQSHPTLDAANVLAQLVVRQDKNNPAVAAQAARLLRQLPAANEPDELYWYFGTHAMFQLGNRWWSRWEASVGPAVVTNQVIAEPVPGCRADQAPRHGSWNPDGAWSQRYGRVYATAMSVLTLAVYYRYEKVGGAPGAPEPPPADPAPASPDAPAQAQAGDSSGDADRHAPIQLQNPDPTPPAHDDPQADRDVRDDHNEDPTNDPTNADLRPNPTPDSSNVESPYPNQGFNGSLGMGGNIGGGGGSAGGSGGHRYRRASGGGGHRSVQNTMLSLRFLADSQNIDGSWPADAGQLAINLRTAGRLGVEQALSLDPSHPDASTMVTGLSLLAFLSAGYTHTEGEYANVVKKALRYLKAVQDHDGCFDHRGRKGSMVLIAHIVCTMAMAEAYAMTGANLLKGPAQKGVDFICASQNQHDDVADGWGNNPRDGKSNTLTTAWAIVALRTARMADLDVPVAAFSGGLTFLASVTDGNAEGGPRTGYQSTTDGLPLPGAATPMLQIQTRDQLVAALADYEPAERQAILDLADALRALCPADSVDNAERATFTWSAVGAIRPGKYPAQQEFVHAGLLRWFEGTDYLPEARELLVRLERRWPRDARLAVRHLELDREIGGDACAEMVATAHTLLTRFEDHAGVLQCVYQVFVASGDQAARLQSARAWLDARPYSTAAALACADTADALDDLPEGYRHEVARIHLAACCTNHDALLEAMIVAEERLEAGDALSMVARELLRTEPPAPRSLLNVAAVLRTIGDHELAGRCALLAGMACSDERADVLAEALGLLRQEPAQPGSGTLALRYFRLRPHEVNALRTLLDSAPGIDLQVAAPLHVEAAVEGGASYVTVFAALRAQHIDWSAAQHAEAVLESPDIARHYRALLGLAGLLRADGHDALYQHCLSVVLDRLVLSSAEYRQLWHSLEENGGAPPPHVAEAWRRDHPFDVNVYALHGNALLDRGDTGLAWRWITSVVEFAPREADPQRTLGRRFAAAGRYAEAERCFRNALELRPEEPASMLDMLRMAIARDAGLEVVEAMHRKLVTTSWDSRFGNVVKLADRELALYLSRAEAAARASGDTTTAELLRSRIMELRTPGLQPARIKVIVEWDTDTDIDLWVTHGKDRCYYRHRDTAWGGKLIDDITTGHGPEVFSLVSAGAGDYLVQAHYYSGRTGIPLTTISVTILTDEGTSRAAARRFRATLTQKGELVPIANLTVPAGDADQSVVVSRLSDRAD